MCPLLRRGTLCVSFAEKRGLCVCRALAVSRSFCLLSSWLSLKAFFTCVFHLRLYSCVVVGMDLYSIHPARPALCLWSSVSLYTLCVALFYCLPVFLVAGCLAGRLLLCRSERISSFIHFGWLAARLHMYCSTFVPLRLFLFLVG